jgi:hypothetical protein
VEPAPRETSYSKLYLGVDGDMNTVISEDATREDRLIHLVPFFFTVDVFSKGAQIIPDHGHLSASHCPSVLLF